jgi:hypothetical protein
LRKSLPEPVYLTKAHLIPAAPGSYGRCFSGRIQSDSSYINKSGSKSVSGSRSAFSYTIPVHILNLFSFDPDAGRDPDLFVKHTFSNCSLPAFLASSSWQTIFFPDRASRIGSAVGSRSFATSAPGARALPAQAGGCALRNHWTQPAALSQSARRNTGPATIATMKSPKANPRNAISFSHRCFPEASPDLRKVGRRPGAPGSG